MTYGIMESGSGWGHVEETSTRYGLNNKLSNLVLYMDAFVPTVKVNKWVWELIMDYVVYVGMYETTYWWGNVGRCKYAHSMDYLWPYKSYCINL